MLRSYDSRLRPPNRSPEVYLSQECSHIVGEGTKTILQLTNQDSKPDSNGSSGIDASNDDDEFWNESTGRTLQVIVTPYRHGHHVATTPKAFLPVISQLEDLHEQDFVHGDIRAFNTVFGEHSDQGYLIDFDFGGKLGRRYPTGYHQDLADGLRIESEINGAPNEIHKWHDWYALGRLIFFVHEFVLPEGATVHRKLQLGALAELDKKWKELTQDPTPDMLAELKEFLRNIHDEGWSVKPSRRFNEELQKVDGRYARNEATKPGATGSPPEKNR